MKCTFYPIQTQVISPSPKNWTWSATGTFLLSTGPWLTDYSPPLLIHRILTRQRRSHSKTPFKTDWTVVIGAFALVGAGVFGVVWSRKNRTIKISSLRLLVQIVLLCLVFGGIFFDHQYLPIPATELSPHEVPIGATVLGVSMPDGLAAPFLACYYPCGRTVTCALWQIQTYIYPFFNVGGGWGVHYTSTGIERLAIVFGIVIIAAVLLGRVFCGWVCPFGLYLDLMTRLRKALRIKARKLSDKFNDRFHQLGYLILALIIILSVVFASQAIAGIQLVPGTEKGRICLELFLSAFLPSLPDETFLHSKLCWPWFNADKLGNPNHHRRSLSTRFLLDIA